MSSVLFYRTKSSLARIVFKPSFRWTQISHYSSGWTACSTPFSSFTLGKDNGNQWNSFASYKTDSTVNSTDSVKRAVRKKTKECVIEEVITPGQKTTATLTYSDNGKYVGEWKNHKKHGTGIQTFSMGGKYEGEWFKGLEQGQGTRTSSTGQILQGEFYKGKILNGQGVLELNKKNELEGVWVNGKLDGWGKTVLKSCVFKWELKNGESTNFGTQTFTDGTVYEGMWANKIRHGQGKLTYPGGQVLQGIWEDGKFQEGHGTLILPLGEVLEGTWIAGKMEGRGKLNSVRQKVMYMGDFQQGLKHGLGLLSFHNGAKYVGEFVDGKKHGQGTYTSHSGKVLEGLWENDKFQNLVTADGVESAPSSTLTTETAPQSKSRSKKTRPDDGKYEGDLEDGQRHGQGTYTSVDGSVSYTGGWKLNKKHGQGRETSPHGTAEGEYQHGHLHNGQGVVLLPHGEVCEGVWREGKMEGAGVLNNLARNTLYKGELRAGLMHGHGSLTYADGTTYVGAFEDNRRHGEGRLLNDEREVVYNGEWQKGQRGGLGWGITSEGVQEGLWAEDAFVSAQSVPRRLQEVVGMMNYPDVGEYEGGLLYEDGMMQGQRNGQGTYVSYCDKRSYTGAWKKDKRHGQGTTVSAIGKCVGEYKNDRIYNGAGVLEEANGDVFEGQWVKGLMTGQGVQRELSRKSTYEGELLEGRRHGQGTHSSAKGKYTGAFVHGKKHGQGTWEGEDGQNYSGEWVAGKRQGRGKATTSRGWTEGEYVSDKIFTGHGEVTTAKGVTLQRVWVQGVLQVPYSQDDVAE